MYSTRHQGAVRGAEDRSASTRDSLPGKRTLTEDLAPGRGAVASTVRSAPAEVATAPSAPTATRIPLHSLFGRPPARGEDGAVAGGGLPAPLNARMSQAFGADFSHVRVHTESAEAPALGARAFARGNDLHFAPGQWSPDSDAGQALIGHELTHVVQQSLRAGQPMVQASGLLYGNEPLEREADDLGARAARGESIGSRVSRAPSGEVQAKLELSPGRVLTQRNEFTNSVVLPETLLAQVVQRFGSKPDRKDKVITQLQRWANDETEFKQFSSEDEAVIAAGEAVGVTVLNVFQGDEQPLYEYGKDYRESGTDSDPSSHNHTGISETTESREKAAKLLAMLEAGFLEPPEGYDADDFLPNNTPYMIGVLVTSRSAVIAAKSGGPAPKGFLRAVHALEYKVSNGDVDDLRGFTSGFDISSQHTDHKRYGHCALPKVVSGSSDRGGFPTGVTEMYFSPADPKRNVTAVGLNGQNQQFHHGTVVPSCDTCREFSPEQLKGLPKHKRKTGGTLRREPKPQDKNRIERHGKHYQRDLRTTIDEGLDLSKHLDDLDDDWFDDDEDKEDEEDFDPPERLW